MRSQTDLIDPCPPDQCQRRDSDEPIGLVRTEIWDSIPYDIVPIQEYIIKGGTPDQELEDIDHLIDCCRISLRDPHKLHTVQPSVQISASLPYGFPDNASGGRKTIGHRIWGFPLRACDDPRSIGDLAAGLLLVTMTREQRGT